jgi:hypothetical protein
VTEQSLPARPVTAQRSGAVFGLAFIVVLFLSAAAVSLPEPNASGQQIVDFYSQHRAVVTAAQLFALCTAPLLVLFALRLRAVDRPSGTAALPVAVVGPLPAIVALILAFIADPRHIDAAHGLNIAAGITDDLLFLIIASFAATVWAGRTAYRPWLRGIAAVVSLLCLIRGVLGFAHVQGPFDVAAPIAFLILIAALSIRMLRRWPLSARSSDPRSGM